MSASSRPIIGVIGGSGLYKLQGLKVLQQINVKTVGYWEKKEKKKKKKAAKNNKIRCCEAARSLNVELTPCLGRLLALGNTLLPDHHL